MITCSAILDIVACHLPRGSIVRWREDMSGGAKRARRNGLRHSHMPQLHEFTGEPTPLAHNNILFCKGKGFSLWGDNISSSHVKNFAWPVPVTLLRVQADLQCSVWCMYANECLLNQPADDRSDDLLIFLGETSFHS